MVSARAAMDENGASTRMRRTRDVRMKNGSGKSMMRRRSGAVVTQLKGEGAGGRVVVAGVLVLVLSLCAAVVDIFVTGDSVIGGDIVDELVMFATTAAAAAKFCLPLYSKFKPWQVTFS